MFELIRKTELKEYNGTGFLYRHDKTGMEVYHIKNDNKELCANFIFSTPSEDSKGVAHIIEHTVLNGSGNYPLKDPFFEIVSSSPNTFLNAITFTDKTMYPFASPLKKDFDILFGIYSDAVFNALLRKESFEQEGVRFFEDKFDGVVYNEMTGALSTEDSILQRSCLDELYRGTPAFYVSGGDPVYIADLTYEQYRERYSRWYSPSNCRLFLFGDLDAEFYMNKIETMYLNEKHLKRWQNTKYTTESFKYFTKDYKPVHYTNYCPSENASSVVMSWLTGNTENAFEMMAATVLVDILLGYPGAPLYKAIIESGLGEDLNPVSGTDEDMPGLPFLVGYKGAKPGKENEIEEFIMSCLKKLVKDGIPKEMVDAAIKRQEFKTQEIPGEGYPFGLMASIRASRTWLRGESPEEGLITTKPLEQLKQEVAKGHFFENWIQEKLIDNKYRSLITVKTDPQYNEKRLAVLNEKLKARKASEDEAQFAADKAEYEKFVQTEDSPEAMATIGRIAISDLPEQIPSFKEDSKTYGKATLYTFPLFTRKIAYLNLAFDVRNLERNELELLPLLTRLMLMTSTSKHSYEELGTLLKFYTGSFDISTLSTSDVSGKPAVFVTVKVKTLNEDLEKAVELVLEVLKDTNLANKERIKAAVTDQITEFESSYSYRAANYGITRARSKISVISLVSEILDGTECWFNSLKIKKELDENSDVLISKLEKLRDKIFTQNALNVQIGCEEADLSENVEKVEKLIDNLSEGIPVCPSSFYDFVPSSSPKREILQLSSGPAYNIRVVKFDKKSEEQAVNAMLLSSVLSSGYLWDTIRGQNGAYGAGLSIDPNQAHGCFYSYRDPLYNPTFSVFTDSLKAPIEEKEIEYSVVTMIGSELKPLAPGQKCSEAFRRSLLDMTDELYLARRKQILNAKLEDLKEAAQILYSSSVRAEVTVTGPDAIKDADLSNVDLVRLPQ